MPGAMLAPTDEPAAGMALHLRDQFDRPAGDHQTLAAQVLLSGCLGGLWRACLGLVCCGELDSALLYRGPLVVDGHYCRC